VATVSSLYQLSSAIDIYGHNPNLEEMLRRVNPAERLNLEKELATLPKKEESIEELCKALDGQDWQASIFQHEKYPYYALAALELGRIRPMQFATLMLFWSVAQHKPIVIPLFNPDSTVNIEARAFIAATLEGTDINIDDLFELMKDYPPSEQQIFVIADTQTEKTVSRAINEDLHLPFLSRAFGKRMISSLGLMQALLTVRFLDEAVTLNPVLGLSSTDDITYNVLHGTRDVAIPFPGISLPKKADGYLAPDADFPYHDTYHAYLLSSIPPQHRTLFLRIGQIMTNFAEDFSNLERRALRRAAWFFKDQEILIYLPERRQYLRFQSINDIFWKTVEDLLDYIDDKVIDPETCENLFVKIGTELDIDPSIQEGPGNICLEAMGQIGNEVLTAQISGDSPEKIEQIQLQLQRHPLIIIGKIWQKRLQIKDFA
jgi:hypothetical protein